MYFKTSSVQKEGGSNVLCAWLKESSQLSPISRSISACDISRKKKEFCKSSYACCTGKRTATEIVSHDHISTIPPTASSAERGFAVGGLGSAGGSAPPPSLRFLFDAISIPSPSSQFPRFMRGCQAVSANVAASCAQSDAWDTLGLSKMSFGLLKGLLQAPPNLHRFVWEGLVRYMSLSADFKSLFVSARPISDVCSLYR